MPSIGIADKQTLDLVYGAVQNAGSGTKMQYPEEGTVIRDRVVQLKTNGKIANLPEERYEDWLNKNMIYFAYAGTGNSIILHRCTPLSDTKFISIYTIKTGTPTYSTRAVVIELIPGKSPVVGDWVELSTEVPQPSNAFPTTINIIAIDGTRALAFYNQATSGGRVRVLSVSDTTITANTSTAIGGTACANTSFTKVDSTRVAMAFNDSANSNYGTLAVITISGTALSVGTPAVLNANSAYGINTCLVDTDKVAVVVANSSTGVVLRAASLDGFSITLGSALLPISRYNSTAYGEPVFIEAVSPTLLVYAVRATVSTSRLRAASVTGNELSSAGAEYVSLYAAAPTGLDRTPGGRIAFTSGGGTELLNVEESGITLLNVAMNGPADTATDHSIKTPSGNWYMAGLFSTAATKIMPIKMNDSVGLSREGSSTLRVSAISSNSYGHVAGQIAGHGRYPVAVFGDYLLTATIDTVSPFNVTACLAKYNADLDLWEEKHTLVLCSVGSGSGRIDNIMRIDENRFLLTYQFSSRYYYSVIGLDGETLSSLLNSNRQIWSTTVVALNSYKIGDNLFATIFLQSDSKLSAVVYTVGADHGVKDLSDYSISGTALASTSNYSIDYAGVLEDSHTFVAVIINSTTNVQASPVFINEYAGRYTVTFGPVGTLVSSTSSTLRGVCTPYPNLLIYSSTNTTPVIAQHAVRINSRASTLSPQAPSELLKTVPTATNTIRNEVLVVDVGGTLYYVTRESVQSVRGTFDFAEFTGLPEPGGYINLSDSGSASLTYINAFLHRGRIWKIGLNSGNTDALVVYASPGLHGRSIGYLQADGDVVLQGTAVTPGGLIPGAKYGYNKQTGELFPTLKNPIGVAISSTELQINNSL